MADRGKWLKLWLDSLTDLDIAGLSNEDWGFLTRLWMLIKKEGEGGKITFERPALVPCALLHVSDFDALIAHINRSVPQRNSSIFVTIDNRYISVAFSKWLKYQGDWSAERVKKFRKCNGKTSPSPSTSSSLSKRIKEKSEKPSRELIHIDNLQFTDSMKAYAAEHGINGHAIDLFGDMVRWVIKNNKKLTNTLRGWEATYQTFVRKAPELSPKYLDDESSGGKVRVGHISKFDQGDAY